MNLSLSALLASSVFALTASALTAAEPFKELGDATKDRVRWEGPKSDLAALFDAERGRLRKDFEPALLKFVGEDVDRHYWCGCFLTTDTYLAGREPNRLLAVALWEQGLLLAADAKRGDATELRPFHHLLAIEYAKLGFPTLAGHHKARAEQRLKDFDEGGPATSGEDFDLYQSIKPLGRSSR